MMKSWIMRRILSRMTSSKSWIISKISFRNKNRRKSNCSSSKRRTIISRISINRKNNPVRWETSSSKFKFLYSRICWNWKMMVTLHSYNFIEWNQSCWRTFLILCESIRWGQGKDWGKIKISQENSQVKISNNRRIKK